MNALQHYYTSASLVATPLSPASGRALNAALKIANAASIVAIGALFGWLGEREWASGDGGNRGACAKGWWGAPSRALLASGLAAACVHPIALLAAQRGVGSRLQVMHLQQAAFVEELLRHNKRHQVKTPRRHRQISTGGIPGLL